MALVKYSNLEEITFSIGTGDLVLSGPGRGGKGLYTRCSPGDTFRYYIHGLGVNGLPEEEWESGFGTYKANNTVERTSVENSSNAGAKVNFSAGTKFLRVEGPVVDGLIETNTSPSAVSGAGNAGLVCLIGGQSNAEGKASLISTEPTHPLAKMLTKGGLYQRCREPSHVRDAGWINNIPAGAAGSAGDAAHSWATSFAVQLANLYGISALMVPNAIGSTSLAMWEPPPVEDDRTTLFGALTARGRQAAIPGEAPLLLWVGHEANAADTTIALATNTVNTVYQLAWTNNLLALRDRFPAAPMLYAQLGNHSDGTIASNHFRAAEAQRRCETSHGDGSTILKYLTIAPNYSPATWISGGTDSNNTMTTAVDGVSMRLTGDGNTDLFGQMLDLTAFVPYRIVVDAAGTGTFEVWAYLAKIGGVRSAGRHTITVTPDSNGNIRWRRDAAAVGVPWDLTFTIVSVEQGVTPRQDAQYMVVTHDLPRVDTIHYNTAANVELGRRFALAYHERVLGFATTNGKGPRLVSCTKSGATVRVRFSRTVQASATHYGASLATSLFRVYAAGVEQTLLSVVLDTPDTDILITCSATLTGVIVVTYGDRAGPAVNTYRAGCVYDADGLPAPMMSVTAV